MNHGSVGSDGTFECLSVLQEHTQDVKMVVWHPQLDLLASASYDDTIRIWREDEDDWACVATLQGHGSTIWAVDFNQAGTHLVSASDDNSIKIWQRLVVGSSHERWECVQTITDCFTRTVYSVSWNKDVPFGPIVAGSADNTIRVFSSPDSENFSEYSLSSEVHSAHGVSDINTVSWQNSSENKKIFASGGDDCLIRIWSYSP
ncbi:cytosolic iron-sulfur protein assembly [Entomophthora muscae]|uniref:Cytosolic iron-sulfur protein assembly n=2 Tax=Entomophthora muscae TaxID=34485 RepID=A0ACC2TS19_9FUNG|nr:cytosolic iron-sulfur protein assembly [Entomophthora muscae]